MNIPDWLQQLIVAAIGAIGTACVTVVIWIVRLGYRVTSLEEAMRRLEVHQSETARVMTETLAQLRAESRGLVDDIAEAREKALTTFVTKADIRDLIIGSRRQD